MCLPGENFPGCNLFTQCALLQARLFMHSPELFEHMADSSAGLEYHNSSLFWQPFPAGVICSLSYDVLWWRLSIKLDFTFVSKLQYITLAQKHCAGRTTCNASPTLILRCSESCSVTFAMTQSTAAIILYYQRKHADIKNFVNPHIYSLCGLCSMISTGLETATLE